MAQKEIVNAIVLQYPDGDTKELSIDDAKALYRQLDELFGKSVEYVPTQPLVIEREQWPHWMPLIWCKDEGQFTPSSPPQQPQVWCTASHQGQSPH